MTVRYFEDFTVGDTFSTAKHTITLDEIKTFAHQYDPQAFHFDEERAKESVFTELVASGWHCSVLSMRLIVETSGINIVNGIVGLGLESMRWPRPTRPNDTLHVVAKVLECIPSRSRPGWGVIKMQWQTINQDTQVVGEAIPSLWVKCRTTS